MCAGKLTTSSRESMMLTRPTKPSTKPLLVLIGVGLGLVLLGVVVVVAVTRKNHHDSGPGQGTKWEGTLASTVFALDAETGRLRWQRYLPEGPQLIAMRMSRAGVITLEAIILSGPCTGRPVSLDLDVRTGREVGRRNQLSFTRSVPAPPHGPVVGADGGSAYRVEAGSAGPVVRAVSAAGNTRWQRAFPDPEDHFMSTPTVVTGVVDHAGGLFVAGSADYLGPRRCGRG
jgi:outer membrane protein assembly factor BamB